MPGAVAKAEQFVLNRPVQTMIGTVPPSALHAEPVTYDARSEQRNDDHGRDLLGLGEPAERPPGADGLEHLVSRFPVRRPAGRRARPRPSHASVAVGPGVTALQRIPSFA